MLRDEIKLKLNECLKNKDKKSVSTLRLVLAAVKDRDIAARSNGNNSGISDDEVKLLLQTMIKQRKESADIYENAGRLELLESEKKEIDIISCFLPKQMSNIEISEAVEKIIKETKCDGIKLEGGSKIKDIIKHLVNNKIPVMGHLGILPQFTKGKFKSKGKSEKEKKEIVRDSKLLEEAGVISIML